ncbi:MAG: nitrilase family protein [Paludibacteraceae bacterium]|nr:nitrilase family protein [Paludibacteraceae bacterium]
MTPFRVAILQYPIVWENKVRNLSHTIRRIRLLVGKADLALLPEMFSTGFCTSRPDLAEPIDGPTMQTLSNVAHETGIAICGSFICQEGERLFNRGFFIRPDRSCEFVDKAHLYAHGGEDKFFTAGRERTVITYMGVRFRLLICYDLRFPLWARNTADNTYDILLVCANWPEIRIPYWDALLAARATENQCYIAAANPIGDDGLGLHYNGHSIALGTRLEPLAQLRPNQRGTRIAHFDIDQLHHYRQALPLWKDADPFTMTNA